MYTQDLVMMFTFTTNRNKTENQKLLFEEVCKALERRFSEIKGEFENPFKHQLFY